MRQHTDGRLLATLINHSRFPVKTTIHDRQREKDIPVHLEETGVCRMVFMPPGDAKGNAS